MKFVYLCIITFTASVSSIDAFPNPQYDIENIGSLGSNAKLTALAINDMEQVAGAYIDNDNNQSGFFIWDSKKGLLPCLGIDDSISCLMHGLNNKGEVVGTAGFRKKGKVQKKHFIWKNGLVIRSFEFPDELRENLGINSVGIHLYHFNDLSQILCIAYSSTVCGPRELSLLWEDGEFKVFDESSQLWHVIESEGYNVTSLTVRKLNNKGGLAGEFGYGKLNCYTNEVVEIGKMIFSFEDGNLFTFSKLFEGQRFTIRDYSDNGNILLSGESMRDQEWYSTWMWDKKNGLHEVKRNFSPRSFNTSQEIIGENNESNFDYYDLKEMKWSIIMGGKSYVFSKDLGIEFGEPFSDRFEFDSGIPIQINNHGVVVGNGKIWGKSHPFIAYPRQD